MFNLEKERVEEDSSDFSRRLSYYVTLVLCSVKFATEKSYKSEIILLCSASKSFGGILCIVTVFPPQQIISKNSK